jgi:hypothetical protein
MGQELLLAIGETGETKACQASEAASGNWRNWRYQGVPSKCSCCWQLEKLVKPRRAKQVKLLLQTCELVQAVCF